MKKVFEHDHANLYSKS